MLPLQPFIEHTDTLPKPSAAHYSLTANSHASFSVRLVLTCMLTELVLADAVRRSEDHFNPESCVIRCYIDMM